MNLLLVAFGGALGSVLRFLLNNFITKYVRYDNLNLAKFPWGVLSVNVLGSLLAGILYYFLVKDYAKFDTSYIRNFLLIGFLGGFTTFSTFSLDVFRLVGAGQNFYALIYALSSLIFSILAIFLGFYLVKILSL